MDHLHIMWRISITLNILIIVNMKYFEILKDFSQFRISLARSQISHKYLPLRGNFFSESPNHICPHEHTPIKFLVVPITFYFFSSLLWYLV